MDITINHASPAKTCGQCHPGANNKVIASKVHPDNTQKADFGSTVIALIRKFHIFLDDRHRDRRYALAQCHRLFRKNLILHRIGQARVLFRTTRAQRVQHVVPLTSFFTLVLTGFALRYPTPWLAIVFINESVRSILRRIAGVLLISISLYHLWYLVPILTAGSSSSTCCPTGGCHRRT